MLIDLKSLWHVLIYYHFSSFTDTQLEGGYRSAVQENALVVSLQMFNLILERCINLLKEQLDAQHSPDQENGRPADM